MLSALLACASARADAQRVVLIDPGAELEHAARTALEPWQLDVRVVSLPSPGASAPATHERAHEIALAEDAGVVVWLSEHNTGYALWMYDAAARHAVARPLASAPPFDAPTAAAVALSLKTLLRHSTSAPEQERFGAATAPASETATRAAQPKPRTPGDELRATPVSDATQYDVDTTAGMRFNFVREGSQEFRFGLVASVWPRGRWGGLSLRAALGHGIAIQDARFRGTLFTVTTGLSARFRWDVLRWLRLSAAPSLLADFTSLDDGYAPAVGSVARKRRVVPALALELGADWLALPWLRIGVRGSAAWLLQTQRYKVRDQPVLELSRVIFEAALVLGFGSPNGK